MMDELLSLILELDAFLHIMVMITIIEAILVHVVPLWLHS